MDKCMQIDEKSRERKRKLTILFLCGFLFIGGGTFLFFITLGVRDMKSGDPSQRFNYSYEFRNALLPIFKSLGFTEGETSAGREREGEEGNGLKLVSGEEVEQIVNESRMKSAGVPKKTRSKSPAGKTRIPKMPLKIRGLKTRSAGTSKTSAKISNFASSLSRGGKVVPSGEGEGKNLTKTKTSAYKSVQTAASILAKANDTRSALEAKSRWDKSFEGNRRIQGRMKYDKGGVRLDDIGSKSLVESLKEQQAKSLSIPDVGKPADAHPERKEDAKKKMQDMIAKSMMSAVMDGIGKGISQGVNSQVNQEGVEDKGPPDDIKQFAQEFQQPGEGGAISEIECPHGTCYQIHYNGVGEPPYEGPNEYAPLDITVYRDGDQVKLWWPEE